MSDIPKLDDCEPDQQPNVKKCENDKQYYFSANSFKQIDDDHKEYKKRQELFEYGVDTQCSEAGCGSQASLIDGETRCYICGERILSSKGHFRNNPDGSQCEHVLTATTIAMLCGLSNSAYTEMINKIRDESILILQGNTLVQEFMTFRNKLIRNGIDGTTDSDEGGGKKGIVYKWSHPACNLIKNEYPFIRINFTKDGPIIIDNVGCNSVQYVLQMLWSSKDDHRAIEWRKKFDSLDSTGEEYCYDEEVKEWVDNREKKINEDILNPIKQILGESTQNKLSLFNGISMHILCEIITSKLLSSSTFKISKIGLSLQLKKNFKKILHKTYKKIPESLTKYLQSRDKSPFTMIKGAIKGRFIQGGGRKRGVKIVSKDFSPPSPLEISQFPPSTENFSTDDYKATELSQIMNNKVETTEQFIYNDVLEMSINESVHELLLVNGKAKPVEIISFQHKHNQDIFKFFVSDPTKQPSIIRADDKLPLTNRRINWERVNGRLQRISDTTDEVEDKLLDEIFNYVNLLFMIDKKMEKEVSNMLDYKPYVPLTDLIDDELVRDTLMSNIESITDADPLIVNGIDMDQVGKIKKKKKKKTTKKKPSKKKSSKKKPTKKKSSKKKKAKKKKKTSKKKSY